MSAESAGDLLSDLDHSEILLRLVVGEGEDGVEGTPEDLAGVFFEAPEEVLGGGGLGSSSPFLGLWAAGLFPSLEEERLKASRISFRSASRTREPREAVFSLRSRRKAAIFKGQTWGSNSAIAVSSGRIGALQKAWGEGKER